MTEVSFTRQAWGLYKQGRFAAALESLEPKIFQHREDPAFFRILGLCCLRQGDWKGGETYLQRSRQLDDQVHRDVLAGLMVVAARRRDYGQAVKIGLEILDKDPEDKVAKRALARLRVALSSDGGAGLDKETLGQWLPAYRKVHPEVRRWTLLIGLSVVGLAAVAGGVVWGLSLVHGLTAPVESRKGPSAQGLTLNWNDSVQVGSGFAVTLTPDEVKQAWDQAQKAFQDYHDSRARYQINRLLLSNASAPVKERARELIPYLHDPDFARPDDTSSYQEVRTAPVLYEGCTVRWTGVLTNLVAGDKKITFDLLLGYQNGQVVEGIVPVELTFAALLKNSQVVEVLGRILLRDGQWLVQGTSLRDLGYRAP